MKLKIMDKLGGRRYLRFSAYLNVFTFAVAQVFLIALFPYISQTLQVHISAVVGAFSFGSFLFFWAAPFWAAKSDTVGRMRVLGISLLGLLCSLFILFISLRYLQGHILAVPVLVLSRVVYGLTACAVVPVSQALQVDLGWEGSRTKPVFYHSLSLTLGRATGLVLVLLPGLRVDRALLGLQFGILALCALNYAVAYSSPKFGLAPKVHASQTEPSWLQVKWIVLLGILFSGFTEMIHSSLVPVVQTIFLAQGLATSRWIAQILLFSAAVVILTQVISQVFNTTWRVLIKTGAASLLMGTGLYASVSSPTGLLCSVTFISIGIGLIQPSYLLALSQASSRSEQGKKAGIIGSAHTIGYAAGGALAAFYLKFSFGGIGLLVFFVAAVMSAAVFQVLSTVQSKAIQKAGLSPC